jgi:hypothetical protein
VPVAEWVDRDSLEDHFRCHGAEVYARNPEEYLAPARETIAWAVVRVRVGSGIVALRAGHDLVCS